MLLALASFNSYGQTATIANNTACDWHVVVVRWSNGGGCYDVVTGQPLNCCIRQEDHYDVIAGSTIVVPTNGDDFTCYNASDVPAGSCPNTTQDIARTTFGSSSPNCDSPYAPYPTSEGIPNCNCPTGATLSVVAAGQVEIN